MKKQLINIRVSSDEKEILLKAANKLATQTGQKGTVSKVIRHAVKEYVNQEPSFEIVKN